MSPDFNQVVSVWVQVLKMFLNSSNEDSKFSGLVSGCCALVGQSLSTPEIRSSSPVNGKFISTISMARFSEIPPL